MKRYVIRWVSLTLGLGLMALVGFHWRDITQWGDREIGPGMGGLAGGMAVFFVLLVTVITHSLMILTVRIARAPDWRMSDEQRRNRAAQEAQAALRRGLPAEAIRVYEEAGLFGKAAARPARARAALPALRCVAMITVPDRQSPIAHPDTACRGGSLIQVIARLSREPLLCRCRRPGGTGGSANL